MDWVWLIIICAVWTVALYFLWRFTDQAAKINSKFDREAAELIERLHLHAESRGDD